MTKYKDSLIFVNFFFLTKTSFLLFLHDDLQNEKKRRLGCHGQQIIERRTDTDKIMVEKGGGRKETCQSEFKTKQPGSSEEETN